MFIVIILLSIKQKSIYSFKPYISKCIYLFILVCAFYGFYTRFQKLIHAIKIENKIACNKSLLSDEEIIINEFGENFIFSFLLANELYNKNELRECLFVLENLSCYFTNSEIENMKGKIYAQMKNCELSEKYLIKAINICPYIFEYKYQLFKLYLGNNDQDAAKKIAFIIKNQKEKIPSAATLAIKLEINDYLHSL